ncbi:kynurenine formamidase-like [Saccoglossus kowalevskii]|uniref:Kynurenine formamidase-like n=1 Tax=Saccoglossus kowalevskii TaxID=10224 RepID=A0ABM0MXA0_SACKO|nr:PREDICTED: kynurenine formamidase-like [Saccoglossus kowalevskii]
MVEEVKHSVMFIANKFPDTRGIYVCGHSAGGQLAAMLLTVDWTQYDLLQNIIKGLLLVSGVFDLQPIVKTYVNEPLNLDEAEAIRLSPLCHIKEACLHSKHCKVIVSVGEHDSPSFRTQSREYAKLLKDVGFDIKFKEVEDKDHYNVVHDLVYDNYSLTQDFLKLVNSR